MQALRFSLALALALSLGVACPAPPAPAAQSEREPDVIYVPTPQPVVDAMLEMAEAKRGDVLYDLGSGDGRIPITAARRYGIRAVGIDIDPERIVQPRRMRVRRGWPISSPSATRTCSPPTSARSPLSRSIFSRALTRNFGPSCWRN